MVKDVLLDVGIGEIRLAILENSELAEFYVEKHEGESIVGNVYRGRVERVLSGMQSAFIDIGLSKNAFLYVKDVIPVKYDDYGEIMSPDEGMPHISELLTAGQEITVQVTKEMTGNKGPRLTTRITIPGSFSVLLPESSVVGISKRIEDYNERKRLHELGLTYKPEHTGIIIRTAAENVEAELLKDDIHSLENIWNDIKKREEKGAVPRCLYSEPGFVMHAVREYLSPELNRFVVNDRDTYESVMAQLDANSPGLKMKVEYFSKSYDLFEYYQVETAINEALSRKVWLKSGAYLIFDRTEALTVIDVNSGKCVGKTNLEETALKINTEAAKKIARQIRLRDISGIIITDFIDMQVKEHRDSLVNTLREAVHIDRTQTVVVGMTSLGLVEMTRKKVRLPLANSLTIDCRCCGGTGWRISPITIAKRLEKRIARHLADTLSGYVEVEVYPDICTILNSTEKEHIKKLEADYSCKLSIKASFDVDYEEMRIKKFIP